MYLNVDRDDVEEQIEQIESNFITRGIQGFVF
jgi:hypothetical protein